MKMIANCIAASVFTLLPHQAAAQTCASCLFQPCHSVRASAPAELWGELQPTDQPRIPTDRDSSDQSNFGKSVVTGRTVSLQEVHRWIALASEGETLWTVTAFALQSWSLENPADPNLIRNIPLSESGLVADTTGHTEAVFQDVAVSGNRLLVAGYKGLGPSIWDISDRKNPVLLFQDSGNARRVHIASGVGYAAGRLDGRGVRSYDLLEPKRSGTLGTHERAMDVVSWLDGVIAVGARPLGGPGGVLFYNQTGSLLAHDLVGLEVWDLAAWSSGSRALLAVRSATTLSVYDRGNLSAPLWSRATVLASEARVTFSSAGIVPMLYAGSGKACGNGDTGELLLDVSDPSRPRSVMPPSYWRFYQWDSPSGFNYHAPNDGLFVGDFLYRAGGSILDVHRRISTAPAASPTMPAPVPLPTASKVPTVAPTNTPTPSPESPVEFAVSMLEAVVDGTEPPLSEDMVSRIVSRLTGVSLRLARKIPTPAPTVTPTLTRTPTRTIIVTPTTIPTRTPTPRPTVTSVPWPWERTPTVD